MNELRCQLILFLYFVFNTKIRVLLIEYIFWLIYQPRQSHTLSTSDFRILLTQIIIGITSTSCVRL